MMNFGPYIAARRKALGLSQNDLANALGYSDTAISKMESGLSSPAISLLPNIANTLELTIDDLVKRNENPAPFSLRNNPYNRDRICANLLGLRKSHKLHQDQEAAIFEVSKRTIINYEQGESDPTLATLDLLLAYYKIEPHAFFYEDLSLKHPSAFPKVLIPLLAGFLVGAATLSGILLPNVLKTANSAATTTTGSYQVVPNSTSNPNGNDISISASPFGELLLLGANGQSNLAVKPGSSLVLSVHSSTRTFLITSRENYSFSFSYPDAPSGVSVSSVATDSSYPSVTLSIPNSAPTGSFFDVFASVTILSSKETATSAPCSVTVTASGSF
jgi:transcriptional regulator with XRE-family HTH domain